MKPDGIAENIALAPLTTMQVGGNARYFLPAKTVEQLSSGLAWARAESIPVFILGGGSNTIFDDDGFPGLVIRIEIRAIDFTEHDGAVHVRAMAGQDWDPFVAEMVKRKLAGIECLSGIPGSVGATPVQNVGAYGQEVSDTIVKVEAIDRGTLQPTTFDAIDCQFGYRTSRFKTSDRDHYVVTAVTFRLQPNGKPGIRYGELAKEVEKLALKHPSLEEIRELVLKIRRRKAMVVDPLEPNSRSCGSFFTNPIVPTASIEAIVQRGKAAGAIADGESMPTFDCGAQLTKIPAAWLIEHSGMSKGHRHGNVSLSEYHVLAIVNPAGGTSREILDLKQIVQERVFSTFGVQLIPEPVIVSTN